MNPKSIVLFCVLLMIFVLLSACDQSSVSGNKTFSIPEPESQGGKLLKKYCSSCHGAPRPASHKADEWLNIVLRMQNHRIMNAYTPLTEMETQELVNYLKKHAANKT